MIRRNENPFFLTAGALSVLVHGLFFVVLFVSLNWKTAQPLRVSEVELWDSLPAAVAPEPKPEPEPLLPKPVIEPKPEPPAPPLEPKAEISVKKPKPKPVEKPKPDPKQKAREEAKKREEELERLRKQLAAEDQQAVHDKLQREAQQVADARAAAQARGALNEHLAAIARQIRQHVIPQVCGNGKPVLVFNISLMPTGHLMSPPRLKKGSGIQACDEAVERAIWEAQPLPLPSDPDLISRLRDLELNFKPNE